MAKMTSWNKTLAFGLVLCALLMLSTTVRSVRADTGVNSIDETKVGSATDSQANAREKEAISADGLNAAEREIIAKEGKQYEFQAEVGRLMDIIINSLYSNREIFLREIISNAADACDKIRFEALTDKSKLGDQTELDIRVQFDKDAKTITLIDKGIGMTREGLIKNLGVVAHSGTTEFLQKASAGENPLSLIGQFGVGFYSVYLVADEVTVVSKHNDDDQHIWQSRADKTFTVTKDPRGNTLGRGTSVTLHLKEDATEFLNEETLKRIIGKYSEFIQFPIYLLTHKEVEKEVPDEEAQAKADAEKAEAEEEAKKDGDDVEVSEEDAEEKKEEDKPKMKKIKETVSEWLQVNSAKAIWTRSPNDITQEEYDNFYKSITKDENAPLTHIHFKAEGELSFKSLLYIPKKAPEGYYDKFYEKSQSLKLYVRKVLISDEFEEFMPRYLNFIKGVVDSDDLPLNVSRETLAQSRVLKVMGKKLTRKALEMIKRLVERSEELKKEREDKAAEAKEKGEEAAEEKKSDEDEDPYGTFFSTFGKSIKLGVIDDRANKVALAKLLRYPSTKSNGKLRSLEEYLADMPAKQKYIYYITGENMAAVQNSPFLERLNKKGYEVLFMVDALDEYVVQNLSEFEGKKLASVTKENLKIDDNEEDKKKKLEEENKDLTAWLKGLYGDRVEKVTVSTRVTKSPAVVVTGQYGWTANMERIAKAQTFSDPTQQTWMAAKKTLEINPRHPIVKEIKRISAEDPSDKQAADLAMLMLDAALLVSGFHLDNMAEISQRILRALAMGLKVDPNATAEEEEEVEEPEAPASGSADGAEGAADAEASPEQVMEDLLKEGQDGARDSSHDEL